MTSQMSAEPTRVRKPRWWQLYVTLPLLAALYLPEMQLHISGTEHILAQLGILGLIYAFLQVWLRANRRALMGIDQAAGESRVRVYEVPAAELAARAGAVRAARPLLRLPEAGLKGVLSTTFEIDENEPASAFPAGSEILYSEEIGGGEHAGRSGG